MSDRDARSRLVNRQKGEEAAAAKDVKKKKRGELKEAAQKKYEEMIAAHEKEIRDFDESHGPAMASSGPCSSATTTKPAAAVVPEGSGNTKVPAAASGGMKYNDMSKKELEEECGRLGLGKKGNREELLTRLLMHTPVASVVVAAAAPRAVPDDEEESDSSEAEGEGEEVGEMTEEQKQEGERQYKREQFLVGAVRSLLEKSPDGGKEGIPLDKLAERLIAAGFLKDPKNLDPARFGVKTIAHVFRHQQHLKVKGGVILPC